MSRLPQTTEGEFGHSITLPCDATGSPNPEVKWYKDGVPLAETPNLRFTNEDDEENVGLNINFLRMEDSGMFQCVASNEAGEAVAYTWLKVKSKFNWN